MKGKSRILRHRILEDLRKERFDAIMVEDIINSALNVQKRVPFRVEFVIRSSRGIKLGV